MMNENSFFNLIDQFRRILLFRILYWVARIGLSLTFIISGIRKLPGIRFTALPPDNPVGYYFDAMHETGFYWHFIGYVQIIIGLMLLFNRFAVLSSLLMMPITINIFLISLSLDMQGTPLITSFMLAGNILLLLWYYEHYTPLLEKPKTEIVRINKD